MYASKYLFIGLGGVKGTTWTHGVVGVGRRGDFELLVLVRCYVFFTKFTCFVTCMIIYHMMCYGSFSFACMKHQAVAVPASLGYAISLPRVMTNGRFTSRSSSSAVLFQRVSFMFGISHVLTSSSSSSALNAVHV